nr:glycosyltransferase [Saprospiraceae bacterium]
MKIAINTRFLLAGKLEGIGRYTYEVSRRLVQQQPGDEFIFFFDRPYDPEFCFGPNVQPVVLPPPARHPLLWYVWFEWSIAWALKHYRPDVFFSPDSYLSLRSATPTVLTVHDLAFEHFPEQVPALVKRYYRHFMPRYCHRAG